MPPSIPERVDALEARVEELRTQRLALLAAMKKWMTDPDQQAVLDLIAYLEAEAP
jgi:hypothetical protein